MDFLADNAIWILSVLWIIIFALAFAYAVFAALKLWRVLKATKERIAPITSELSISADAAQQGVSKLEERQLALGEASAELQGRVSSLAIAGRHAGKVAGALRYPVRFLTGL